MYDGFRQKFRHQNSWKSGWRFPKILRISQICDWFRSRPCWSKTISRFQVSYILKIVFYLDIFTLVMSHKTPDENAFCYFAKILRDVMSFLLSQAYHYKADFIDFIDFRSNWVQNSVATLKFVYFFSKRCFGAKFKFVYFYNV